MVEKSEAHFTLARQIGLSTGEELTEVTPRFNELHLRKVRSGVPIYVRVKDQGNGVQRALLVMLWVEALKPKLILWDDFEVSMHPSLIRFAMEWLAKGKWQVVLTTHSLDVLGCFADIESNRNAQLIMLGKDRNDMLDYEVHSPSEVNKLLNANTDPRKLAEALGL
jgi:predicted ATPase